MSIRRKFLLAFSVPAALACSLAFSGFRGIAASGDLVVRLYDGPLIGINRACSADAALNEGRLLITPGLGASTETVRMILRNRIPAFVGISRMWMTMNR